MIRDLQPSERPVRSPGWPEVAVALTVYIALIVALGVFWLLRIPDQQSALRGIVGMAMNGVVGTVALLAAFTIRIRDFGAFGFRNVAMRWLLAGFVLGAVAFVLSLGIERVYFSFITEPNNQADFQAAATAGLFSLLILIFSGAILTPFGEEAVFRGVIANALNRYGAWAGVAASAFIFAAAHGPSVIFVNALMVGVLTGALFRRTNSVWPGFVTHVVYNGVWLIVYSLH